MGYTHYAEQKRTLTQTEWHEVRVFAETLFKNSPAPLSGCHRFGKKPRIDADLLWLNGVGENEHETFGFNRVIEVGDESFFCKTNRKPYDIVVVAILCFLESRFPDAFVVGSDGGPLDWSNGQHLAAKTAPNVPISIPAEVLKGSTEYPPVCLSDGFKPVKVTPPHDYSQSAIF